ncbi:hypothetical protein SAMN05216464_12834 [Mucilaginibacter pineti]|uniref:Uncharacterized protein n=1 Tax=Mucilaginibacter pineti TaxID=1391627 RepID=A0A1G7NNT2_9SPHI|nr:hypothetical protein [Mucilaginibacter pineti]SDF75601.1 hypothetical protein SAMN05216464_12834 [Mucilaginibacter pineti]
MKRSVVWLLHTGYWLLFLLLLLTFFFFAVFVPAHSRLSGPPVNGLAAWARSMLGFAVLPGITTFYVCYTYLFYRLLSRQRFMLFIVSSILVALIASCMGAAFAPLPFVWAGFSVRRWLCICIADYIADDRHCLDQRDAGCGD